MAARLIHDFKNQLGGLKLYAAYLQKRFADNAEGMEITEKIARGLNEMAEQAAMLNKLCRPLELQMAPGDPAPLVEAAVSKLGPRASAKRVKISCDLEPGAPLASFDQRQFVEALEAIVARAVDASPEDGEIGVSLRRRDEALRIEITDNGATLDDFSRRPPQPDGARPGDGEKNYRKSRRTGLRASRRFRRDDYRNDITDCGPRTADCGLKLTSKYVLSVLRSLRFHIADRDSKNPQSAIRNPQPEVERVSVEKRGKNSGC
jgi:hypothetical protein